MKPRHFFGTIVGCIVSQFVMPHSAYTAVTLNDGGVTKLEVVARDTHLGSANQIEDLFPTALPFTGGRTATRGNSNSHADYELTQGFINLT